MHRISVVAFALAATIAGASPAGAAGDQGVAKAQEAATLLSRGNANGALALLTEALADTGLTNDRRASLLNDRGVVYGRLSLPKAAIEDFNRAILLFPENASVYNNRGNTLLALGIAKEAVKDFDRAVVLAPGYAAALNNRASAHMTLGQTADAIRDYTRAIELMPTSAVPLGGRGKAHLAEGRPHAAARDFGRALALDPRFTPGYRARADVHVVVERYEDAVEDLSRAVAFDPTSADLVQLRGRAYLLSGNPTSAIKDFSRAIELDPQRVASYEWRGLAHIKAEAFEEADADLTKALELNPRSALAFAYRAWLYKQTGQPEIATREIDKAARIDAARAEVVWVKAEIAEVFGRTQDAVAGFQAALAANPGLLEARQALQRLGVDTGSDNDVEVPGAGIAPWRVVTRSGRYFAISQSIAKVRVPLEMVGSGQPKLLEWEIKKPPYAGIALLRFSAGQVVGAKGPEETEQVAILDLAAPTIVGIQPHRTGSLQATWTWGDGRVTVASVDGVKDEFVLRSIPKVAAIQPPIVAPQPTSERRPGQPKYGGGTPDWAPWAGQDGQRPRQSQAPRKPKTLFDYILGN